MKLKNKSGQILVVVLLALTIISIFVVVVATNARRDVVERVQNEQYEQALSLSEDKLLRILNDDFDPVEEGCQEIINGSEVTGYTCIVSPEEGTDSSEQVQIDIDINEEIEINNLSVKKDAILKIGLKEDITNTTAGSYKDYLDFSWTGNVAWIFSLDYRNRSTGEFGVIKDVYDGNSTFFNNPDHCFNFAQFGGNGTSNAIRINLNSVGNTANGSDNCLSPISSYDFLALRMRPLMQGSGTPTTDLTLEGYRQTSLTDAALPPQVRVITAESYSLTTGTEVAPRAILEVQEPLFKSPVEILDYVLRSEQPVTKEN